MLMMTEEEQTFWSIASWQAVSTASMPSVSTAARIATIRRSLSCAAFNLRRTRSISVLVAPASKLATLAGADPFDASIPVEGIIDILTIRRIAGISDPEIDARVGVRIGILEAICGKRQYSSWVSVTISTSRDFAKAYAELAASIVPELSVRPSTDGPKAITGIFDGLRGADSFP